MRVLIFQQMRMSLCLDSMLRCRHFRTQQLLPSQMMTTSPFTFSALGDQRFVKVAGCVLTPTYPSSAFDIRIFCCVMLSLGNMSVCNVC